MDMEKLRQQLIIDEGVKYEVYLDHLSLKTCGIGHYIRQDEPEFDLVIGMYHDQVLTPIKSIFKFNAINITAGLPFVRVSPDHGPNSEMYLKNKSDPSSIFCAMDFFNKIK